MPVPVPVPGTEKAAAWRAADVECTEEEDEDEEAVARNTRYLLPLCGS